MYQPRGRGGSRRGRENATANNKTTKVPLKGLFSDGVWKCTAPTLSPIPALLFPCILSRLPYQIQAIDKKPQVTATPASQPSTSKPKMAVKTTVAGSTPANTHSPNAAISSSGAMKQKPGKLLPCSTIRGRSLAPWNPILSRRGKVSLGVQA